MKLEELTKKPYDYYWDDGLYVMIDESDDWIKISLPKRLKVMLTDLLDFSHRQGYKEAQKNIKNTLGL
jgi:hypothetical protein